MAHDFTENVLKNFGGVTRNNLNNIIESEDDSVNEISTKSFSPYKIVEDLPEYMLSHKNGLCTLTLNCQSLNAKFDQIKAMLHFFNMKKFIIHIICLQETWVQGNPPDLSMFQLPGYEVPIGLGASVSKHGGLAIYLIEGLTHSIIHSTSSTSKNWEGLFIKVTGADMPHPIIIGNVYRPPRENNNNSNIENFIKEYSPVIQKICKPKTESLVVGDLNIDLLQINHREKYADYFDFMLSQGLFPKITFPTRFSNYNATLLDHIFHKTTNENYKTKSAIIWGCYLRSFCMSH